MNELNLQDSQLIDKYLRSQLTDTEQLDFDQRMQDEQFADEVGFRSSLLVVSEEKGNEKLHSLLEKESQRLDNIKPKKKPLTLFIFIALLIVAGLCYLWIQSKQSTPEELYIAHYEKFPNLIAPTERSDATKMSSLEQAMYAYDNHNYVLTVVILDTMDIKPEDLTIYHAISKHEIGQTKEAISLLLSLASSEAKYNEAAEWYLCLFNMKIDNEEQANYWRNKILSHPAHKYQSKVKQLQ